MDVHALCVPKTVSMHVALLHLPHAPVRDPAPVRQIRWRA
jgi:hypothetical protein